MATLNGYGVTRRWLLEHVTWPKHLPVQRPRQLTESRRVDARLRVKRAAVKFPHHSVGFLEVHALHKPHRTRAGDCRWAQPVILRAFKLSLGVLRNEMKLLSPAGNKLEINTTTIARAGTSSSSATACHGLCEGIPHRGFLAAIFITITTRPDQRPILESASGAR